MPNYKAPNEQSERIIIYFGIYNVTIGSCHLNHKNNLMLKKVSLHA